MDGKTKKKWNFEISLKKPQLTQKKDVKNWY